ncbi:ABC transporter substrate-binding protein [Rhodobacteraceae bacterium 10Alg 79]|uniref:ABC transporter substrate-binding protein n=1 Tax=Rhodalgimonas zhirmunskyi TaxID=2964767 RepID=A0AAJ1UGS4_9RHOB|nr:ABC transporter substrate-binding protein [Rhodoalgimonas zhirmunskyi]
MSINLCTDQLAMLVAAPGQLVSVSFMARDPRASSMAEDAAEVPINHARAEEIYLLKPDLVLAGRFTSPATVSMLRRLGIPVAQFDTANTLADVALRLEEVGAALGQGDKAAALAQDYRAKLAAFAGPDGQRPYAILFGAGGYTAGRETLAGHIIRAAGFDNAAEDAGFAYGGFMPLEILAMSAPDAIITGRPYPGASRADAIMEHPVLQEILHGRPRSAMTDRDWVCGTPAVLGAVARTADLRRLITGGE